MKILKPFLKAVLEYYDQGKPFDEVIKLSEFYQKRVTNDNINQLFEGFVEKNDGWYLELSSHRHYVFNKAELFEIEVTVDMLASMADAISCLDGEKVEIKIKEQEDDK